VARRHGSLTESKQVHAALRPCGPECILPPQAAQAEPEPSLHLHTSSWPSPEQATARGSARARDSPLGRLPEFKGLATLPLTAGRQWLALAWFELTGQCCSQAGGQWWWPGLLSLAAELVSPVEGSGGQGVIGRPFEPQPMVGAARSGRISRIGNGWPQGRSPRSQPGQQRRSRALRTRSVSASPSLRREGAVDGPGPQRPRH